MITPTEWDGSVEYFRTVLPTDNESVHVPSGVRPFGSLHFYLDVEGEIAPLDGNKRLLFRVGISRGRMEIRVIHQNGGLLRKRLYNHHNTKKLMDNFQFAFRFPELWCKHKAKPKWMEHATVTGEIRHGHNT